jgi:hypothetical protein
LIELREKERLKIRLILQVDTLCHRIPNFIEKAARAGCNNVFIGLENINPESLMGTKKRQNKIWEYREMLQMWRKHRVVTWCGYILGFPTDTPESIARDIETIKRELPVDILEFFCLTPLPGSEDHKKLFQAGIAMDPDMNKYDLEHVVTGHSHMSQAEWQGVYRDAWARYYTDEHVATIMRRAVATGLSCNKITEVLIAFAGGTRIEKVHPLQLGLIRRKIRTQRRSGLPHENPVTFYPRRVYETFRSIGLGVGLLIKYRRMMREAIAAPSALDYKDAALTALLDDHAGTSEFIQAYADKLPNTYGAPVKHATEAEPVPAS